ncbi:MAG: Hsp70 family protein [Polyangiaceae bacterium]|nr:Hsp70 family protein [Polyangiaceae bacterium]
MPKVALDFGTANTVVARHSESIGRAECLSIPDVSTEMRYRLSPDQPEELVYLVPSMIYYSETETLIGDQVLSRGLGDHRDTFRWMKRSLSQGATKRKKTAQGFKSYAEAAGDFLYLLLSYLSNQVSLETDEFTFTLPVEAFEDFQAWLFTVAERLELRRLRFMDEPTACVTGMLGACRKEDRFLVFDFGCGTLDVSAVRIDLDGSGDKRAVQLGKAGADLGGMDLDRWIADDFCARHALDGQARREVDALIERRAEEVKIILSDPLEAEATLSVPVASLGRTFSTVYHRSCSCCAQGGPRARGACLGCLLQDKRPPEDQGFPERVRQTIERALENAAVHAGMRRSELTRVLVTGGTSLVPAVTGLLKDLFDGKLAYERPFDAVARGACTGLVVPILQHDYAIEGYSRDKKRYEFVPFLRQGTEYPTEPGAVRFWARGSYEGQTAIGVKIFEVSELRKRALDQALVDEDGALRESRVQTERQTIELTSQNPTFIVADPPVNLKRDTERFFCSFWVDGNRTLRITVRDQLSGKTLLLDHPVVRL